MYFTAKTLAVWNKQYISYLSKRGVTLLWSNSTKLGSHITTYILLLWWIIPLPCSNIIIPIFSLLQVVKMWIKLPQKLSFVCTWILLRGSLKTSSKNSEKNIHWQKMDFLLLDQVKQTFKFAIQRFELVIIILIYLVSCRGVVQLGGLVQGSPWLFSLRLRL